MKFKRSSTEIQAVQFGPEASIKAIKQDTLANHLKTARTWGGTGFMAGVGCVALEAFGWMADGIPSGVRVVTIGGGLVAAGITEYSGRKMREALNDADDISNELANLSDGDTATYQETPLQFPELPPETEV